MTTEKDNSFETKITADIISAYVSRNPVSTEHLPELIKTIFGSIQSLSEQNAESGAQRTKPAVPISRSLTDDYIICLEDGKKFKSLKRHLRSHYDMSPEEYRAKWGLPHHYPMVAPNYAKKRSMLAREFGLGKKSA